MPLVFRKLQNTPLSNNQLDENFEYLRDQIDAKVNTTALTAAYIAGKLNTPALLGENTTQNTLQLAQSNNLNAWKIRDFEPSILTPGTSDKTSIVVRASNGTVNATTFVGELNGNATSSTSATTATSANALGNYIVPIEKGGTNATTVAAARANLKALSVESDNQMLSLLKLLPSSSVASIAFGIGIDPTNVVSSGDMWFTANGFRYRTGADNKTIAPLESPTFTGSPAAPAHPSVSEATPYSPIATTSHIAATVTTLNAAIALKSNINSPQFTGIPTLDASPAAIVNNTSIATTGHVHSVVNNSATTLTTSYQNYTTSAVFALSNSVNQSLVLKANLANPTFTGIPRSTNPPDNDNSDRIATTAYTLGRIATLEATIAASLSGINNAIASTRPVPTGSVFYIASSVVPNGYLEANGAALSRATYASLWEALGSPNTGNGSTTFNLPDLRGEFIRGWDNGRGIDENRAINSFQYSQVQRHKHVGPYAERYSSPFGSTDNIGYQGSGRTDGDNYLYHTNDGSDYDGIVNAAGVIGNETRPRNVALMPIIKY